MSTEKDQNQEIKIFTKIIKFPNVKENKQLEDQKKAHAQISSCISGS